MATVSLVIPSYNRCDLLVACLDSVAQQSRQPNEIIVVDDGSTDGTLAAMEARSDVNLVVQENAGPGAARNRGAALATGDYIAFLDSDDVWFPWSLETMMAGVEQENTVLLFGEYVDFSSSAQAARVDPEFDTFPDYLSAAAHGFFAGAGMMVIDREAFLAVGGFSEDRLNAEDHDLALRLGTANGFVKVRAPVTIGHRIHDDNAMGDAMANWRGVARLIARERAGAYPGGRDRQKARQTIIGGHARAAIVALVQSGQGQQAWQGYLSTWFWNARLGRFKFLLALPVLLLRQNMTAGSRRQTEDDPLS